MAKRKTATKAAADALRTGEPVKASDVKTTASDETPEAQPTKAAKTAAAEEQFAKADSAGEPLTPKQVREQEEKNSTPEERSLRRTALGW